MGVPQGTTNMVIMGLRLNMRSKSDKIWQFPGTSVFGYSPLYHIGGYLGNYHFPMKIIIFQ